jgi:broad specificity phosphatase PhoE
MLAVLTAAGIAFAVFHSATTTVVVLARSFERHPGTINNPPLSPEGEQRAERLAQLFAPDKGTGSLDAIYVSDVRSAQQTAAPLAERLHKTPIVVPGKDVEDFAGRVMDEHGGDTVLVVGSDNLVPELARELSGLDMGPVSQDEADALYVVSIPSFGRASVLRLKY